MTFTHSLSTNNYGPAKFIVSRQAANGTHTTITSALASAVSGDTIVIRDGTYTENITLKAGVAIQSFEADGLVGNVILDGIATFIESGTASICGVKFQTSILAPIITVSGTNACTLDLQDCVFLCNNGQAVSVTNSNASTVVKMYDCEGDISSLGLVIFSSVLGASFEAYNCYFTNSVGSTSENLVATSGSCKIYNCLFQNGLNFSGTTTFDVQDSIIDWSAANQITLTVSSSGSSRAIRNTFYSGTASAINVVNAGTLTFNFNTVNSSNTNAITGNGSISYGTIDFTGSSSTINTTTQTALNTKVGSLIIKTPITITSPVPVTRDSTTGEIGVGPVSGFTPTDVTGSTQALSVQNLYITDRGGGVTYTLPATAALGDVIKIDGKLGLTSIAQNANQAIRVGSALSTTGVGGSVVGTNLGDCITLRCTTSGASTIWIAENFVGNWTVT